MTVSPDKLIDGKAIAEALKKEIAAEVAEMLDKGLDAPHLAAIIVSISTSTRMRRVVCSAKRAFNIFL